MAEPLRLATEKELPRFLDSQFAEWLVKNFSSNLKTRERETLQRIAAAVSYAVYLKHSCVDLAVYRGLQNPVLDHLLAGIQASDVKQLVTPTVRPLVCSSDGNKIWLHKYHAFEKNVATQLLCMQTGKRLEIITGGPGTGKTWTAAQRIRDIRAENPQARILLAAPTGKAANNMMAALPNADIKAFTLHSLLGMNRHSPKPRFHRDNPLRCDVLIVDEASMIDLPMMFHLLQAIPDGARLLLLGDKEQLASVEAGSALHEICATPVFANTIQTLTESRRYRESPEIGALATALNKGLVPDMAANRKVRLHTLSAEHAWNPPWLAQTVKHFETVKNNLAGKTIRDLLQAQKDFQILCALREGPQGVNGINAMLERALQQKPESWYAGKPVMITQNSHERKLYNGDVGLVLPVEDSLKACFIVEGEVKTISVAQMPAYETCYAITVHKSQGSEYDHVLIVLPADNQIARYNPVLTRELVYTAVTRAKNSIDIWCGDGVLETVASKTLQRMSGLGEWLV